MRAFWSHVSEAWDREVSPDLQQTFGIDTETDEFWRARPWWWARARIFALLDDPSTRLARWVADHSER